MLSLGWVLESQRPKPFTRFMYSASPFHLWALSFLICTLKGLNLKSEGPLSSKSSSWVSKLRGVSGRP